MNVQELATIRRYRIPLRIVLFDNSGLGLVRQWQTLFFERRFSEVDLPDNPDRDAGLWICRSGGQARDANQRPFPVGKPVQTGDGNGGSESA